MRAGHSRNTAYRIEKGDPGLAFGQMLEYLMEAAERIEDGRPVPANLELISGNRLGNLCRDHRALQPAQQ